MLDKNCNTMECGTNTDESTQCQVRLQIAVFPPLLLTESQWPVGVMAWGETASKGGCHA